MGGCVCCCVLRRQLGYGWLLCVVECRFVVVFVCGCWCVDLCFNMLLGLFSPIVTLLLYVFCSTA